MHSLGPPWSSLGGPEVPIGIVGLIFLLLKSLNGYKVLVPSREELPLEVVALCPYVDLKPSVPSENLDH